LRCVWREREEGEEEEEEEEEETLTCLPYDDVCMSGCGLR